MDFPHVVLARLHEHIEPIDRGERYEDPLQAVLDDAKVGRVTGGGSQLNELGVIDYADVEIELANLDEALRIVSEALEKSGAPTVLRKLPIGQNARVVVRHGTKSLNAREVRMPRHR